MFYKICRFLVLVYVRIMFRVKVEGRENIPAGGGYILVANHRTNYDPIFVVAAVTAPVRFMAKIELFQKNALLGWALPRVGAFPVERGKGDTGAIDWATEAIRSGAVLGMFPEGTRSKDGTPGRAKSGAALVANQTGAGVLPCAVCYGKELRFRTTVTIRYGKPVSHSELGFTTANSPREIKAASRRMMEEIVTLLGDPQ